MSVTKYVRLPETANLVTATVDSVAGVVSFAGSESHYRWSEVVWHPAKAAYCDPTESYVPVPAPLNALLESAYQSSKGK